MGKGNMQRIKILFFSLAAAMIGLCDVYLMINVPENYLLLVIVSLVFLIVLFFDVNSALRQWEKNMRNEEERDAGLMVSERACYLLLRKKSTEILRRLRKIEEQRLVPLEKSTSITKHEIAKMLDSVMEDQKKIAQVTVSRNKENANALMNSNDLLLERMDDFSTVLGEIERELMEKEEELIRSRLQPIEEKQEKLGETVQSMESSMSVQLQNAVDSILSGQKETFSQKPEISQPPVEINQQKITEQVEQLESSMKQEISRILQRVNELSESMKRLENDKASLSFLEPERKASETGDILPVLEESLITEEPKSIVELMAESEPEEIIEEKEPKSIVELMAESEPEEIIEEKEPKSIVELMAESEPEPEEIIEEKEPKSIVELMAESEPEEIIEEKEPKSIVELMAESEPEPEEIIEEKEPKSIVELMAESEPEEIIEEKEPKSIVELMAESEPEEIIEEKEPKSNVVQMRESEFSQSHEEEPKTIVELAAELGIEPESENKSIAELAAELGAEPEMKPIEEITAELTKREKKEAPIPENNPNKMMSPDEIAALLANISQDEESQTAVELQEGQSEELGSKKADLKNTGSQKIEETGSKTKEVKAVEKEKSAPAAMENPNKVMTPEEIAALIASM